MIVEFCDKCDGARDVQGGRLKSGITCTCRPPRRHSRLHPATQMLVMQGRINILEDQLLKARCIAWKNAPRAQLIGELRLLLPFPSSKPQE